MRILNPHTDIDRFFDSLKRSPALLMLDYDGTLAPLAVERHQCVPYPGVIQRLHKIAHQQHTRVVIITGRSIRDLTSLMKIDPLPEIWGCHGMERMHVDGKYFKHEITEQMRIALQEVNEMSLKVVGHQRIINKMSSVVVFWRDLHPEEQKEIHLTLLPQWQLIADNYEMEILEFDGGIEIRTLGRHKGDVVNELLAEMPTGCAAAFLGDDRTDEDGFAALNGRGLSAFVRKELRPTKADIQIEPPEELLAFFDMWIKTSNA